MEDGRGDHYWYDPEGQLTDAYYGAVDPADNPNNPVRADHLLYDELGNRQSWNLLANRGWTGYGRRDNGLNQYTYWSPISNIYYHDNYPGWGPSGNGVLMADGWITASYNALNQPVAIWAQGYGGNFQWFGYDPLGRTHRMAKACLGSHNQSLPSLGGDSPTESGGQDGRMGSVFESR